MPPRLPILFGRARSFLYLGYQPAYFAPCKRHRATRTSPRCFRLSPDFLRNVRPARQMLRRPLRLSFWGVSSTHYVSTHNRKGLSPHCTMSRLVPTSEVFHRDKKGLRSRAKILFIVSVKVKIGIAAHRRPALRVF